MRDLDEPAADRTLPLPPRPEAAVLVPDRRPPQLRRGLARIAGEREPLRELGRLVVELSRQGELLPGLPADRVAGVRGSSARAASLPRRP